MCCGVCLTPFERRKKILLEARDADGNQHFLSDIKKKWASDFVPMWPLNSTGVIKSRSNLQPNVDSRPQSKKYNSTVMWSRWSRCHFEVMKICISYISDAWTHHLKSQQKMTYPHDPCKIWKYLLHMYTSSSLILKIKQNISNFPRNAHISLLLY